jgi:hypothetical protein
MMRADLVRRLGGYRAAFRAAEDYDLWLRIAEAAGVANLAEPLVAYRRHEANVSRRDAVRQSFSVRLAQRTAAARRSGAGDPATALVAPPDWWAAEANTAFFAPEVGFYRFLDAGPAAAPDHIGAVERSLLRLNHVERKLAQARLQTLLRESGPRRAARRLRMALLIALLHPGRALGMAARGRPA